MAFSIRVTINAWGTAEVEANDQLGGCYYTLASVDGKGTLLDGLNPEQARRRLVESIQWHHNPPLGAREIIETVLGELVDMLPIPELFDDEGRPIA